MALAQSSHSAGGQALGYVHQCLWALVELGKRASHEPAMELRLECLDDIQFESGGSPTELLQTKHHIGTHSAITPNSTDLWRTLNVWMDLPPANQSILRLVTTQKVQTDSDLTGLRSGSERDEEAVVRVLRESAQKSDNKATEKWRKKFSNLDDSRQEDLIRRIVIEDSSPKSLDLDQELHKTFRYAIPAGKSEVFTRLLVGWWTSIAVQLLAGTLDAVAGNDLITAVNDATDQLKSDTLPIDPIVMETFDSSIEESYKDRVFVQQLIWVALDNPRLWKAIRDYHRSYSQRSFWLRHQLLAESELDRFAFRLHDEWEQIFDRKVAEMRRAGRADHENVGQEILDELAKESRAKIRDRFDEPWFNRGTFHALADGELGHRIGWHPEFASKLEEVISLA